MYSIALLVKCLEYNYFNADEEPGEEFEHVTMPDGKVGAKKMRKLQEKEEKKRMREVSVYTERKEM